MSVIGRYLSRKADLENRPLVVHGTENVRQVVVIPILAEEAYFLRTLDALAANAVEELDQTLILCVVNNHTPPAAPPEWVAENERVLEVLDATVAGRATPVPPSLRLGYVDASSSGFELPPDAGVGLARKIGMDFAAALLDSEEGGVICSLDADTVVAPNYLEATRTALTAPEAWGGVIEYAHPLNGPPDITAAIVCYETYLRYHVMGLTYAGSPYAFPTIGSALACTATAYASAGGMSRRHGGEDFYFLQELAKTGRVDHIHTTTVYPSPRPSARVPFGTGPRVAAFLIGESDPYRLYNPESYEALRRLLHAVETGRDMDGRALLEAITAIHPALGQFMAVSGFEEVWARLRANSKTQDQLRRQFHRWFDGLRTVRAIHCLRDHGQCEMPMFEAVPRLLALAGKPVPMHLDFITMREDIEQQKQLLLHLRELARENA
jgi:hypothetical protein